MITNQTSTILYTVVNGIITPVGSAIIGPGGQLIITSSSSGAGSTTRATALFDSVSGTWRTASVPNGILTIGAIGSG